MLFAPGPSLTVQLVSHDIKTEPLSGSYPLKWVALTVLAGDFSMAAAQRSISRHEVRGGFVPKQLKSRGFSGARTEPVQERAITNFHRRLREFLRDAPSRNT